MGCVLVGIDGSDTAAEAARIAAGLAAALDTSLTLVVAHVKDRPVQVQGPGADSWTASAADQALNVANKTAAQLRSIVPDVDVVEAAGKPADVLVEQAEKLEASVIVVGNRRMQGPARVLGAIASAVAHHAPCDVYIAKTT